MNLKLLSLQILTLSALVALSLVIAGTNQPAASAATMDTSDSIIISIPSAIVDLNPLFSNSYYNHYVYQSVYQPLYALYNNTNNLYNWHIVPILAGSYTVTPNGTTWIFNIRPGQVWSDGIPLNASDILFTYQILMNKYIDLNYYSSWSAFFKDNSSNSMRVVNATQLVFNLLPDNLPANTTYIISEVFTTSIFPKHIFGPLGNNPQAWQNDITNTGTGISRTVTADNKVIQVNGPIGSGPYTYAGYDTTNKVWTLMANQRFNAAIQGLKAPSIQTIKLTIISDATTAWTALNAGQIQVVDYNTISFANVFLQPNTNTSVSHPVSFKVDNYQELGYNQFNPIWGMNPVDPVPFYTNYNITLQNGWWSAIDNGNTSNTVRYPHNITWINQLHLAAANAGLGNITADRWFYNNLNDSERLDIRLAMDYAIPRQNIINILNGQGTTLSTWVTPYFNIYDLNIQARPFNESISESLLARVFGYTYNISATDYTSVPYFTMNFLVPNTDPSQILWAEQVQNAFLTIGIKVNVKIVTFNTVQRALFDTSNLGMDYVHGGYDVVFIGGTYSNSVPDFRSFVQPQDYQAAGNYYLINNSQITAISNWMMNQTGPNALNNATAFQQWCYNNVPSSIIIEDQGIFGVSDYLYNFKPTMYQQFNYNEWLFIKKSPPSSILSFNLIDFLLALMFLIISFLILIGAFLFLHSRRKHPDVNKDSELDANLKPNTNISYQTADDLSIRISSSMNDSAPITLIEDILTESFQAPDYATVLKVQQGNFPDYATFKKASDKGITTYAEWLQYLKEK